MREMSRHRRVFRITRRVVALATVIALMIAPFIVILTHGPAAHARAASIAADSAAHEHMHDHGHVHADSTHGVRDGLFDGHNPSDHDHQLHAVICRLPQISLPLPQKTRCVLSEVFRHLTLEGPTRPPRFV